VDTPRASLTFGAASLDRALDELPLPAWLVDRDGRFRWINRAGIVLLGRAVGRLFVNVVAPEHVHTARLAFARKVVGDTPSDIELALITATGERVNVRVASVPMRQEEGVVAILGVVYIVRGDPKQQVVGARRQPDVPTARQREVLVLLAQGFTTRDIAERLGIAHETARNHVRGLLHALGVHSRLHAVIRGYQLGLIPGERDG
jgi:DNA-binding CsgD family transcriptional regulator